MSLLTLSADGKERAHALALYAAQPEHWYRPEVDPNPPGDAAEHVIFLDSYRCVFSYTVAQGHLLRHLSISVRAAPLGKYPHPLAAFTIASWFGFTGGRAASSATARVVDVANEDVEVIQHPGPDWAFEPASDPIPHLVLQQRIGPAVARCA